MACNRGMAPTSPHLLGFSRLDVQEQPPPRRIARKSRSGILQLQSPVYVRDMFLECSCMQGLLARAADGDHPSAAVRGQVHIV